MKRTGGNIDPGDYVNIVGQTFLKHERAPLLVIGARTWNRWSLGRLGCPHPTAAANLNRVCRQLHITSLASLAANAHRLGAYKGLGISAYWTMLAVLREGGYDVMKVHGEEVTYLTMKARATKAAKKSAPRLRRRRAGPPSESTSDDQYTGAPA